MRNISVKQNSAASSQNVFYAVDGSRKFSLDNVNRFFLPFMDVHWGRNAGRLSPQAGRHG
jgi:hypothetical protein